MKCEKCGSEISINNKYCPNCGARNEIGASHVDDMKRFETRFTNTEKDVKDKSRWFVKYITPMVVLMVSVIIYVVLAVFLVNSAYDIGQGRIDAYNSRHEDEITAHIKELMNDGEYLQTYMLFSIADQKLSERDDIYYNGWSRYYNMADYYNSAKKYIISHYTSDNNNYGSSLSKAATSVHDFYSSMSERSFSSSLPESLEYIYDMQDELEQFLKAYCNFTDEDIAGLPDKDTTGIISLMTRRMLDEDN